MMLKSERFREGCADDDMCVRMVAVEAVAEVGTVLLIAGGAAIAGALSQDEQAPPLEGDEAAEGEPDDEPDRPPRRHDYPDWP
ncbi:MAG: hypothetical protein JRI68_30430 [Deltaproteobacteria bacterium]|nr:hypothetical protein [Deltaproteobacteria bacterium]